MIAAILGALQINLTHRTYAITLIRPFGLRNSLRLQRLARRSESLHVEYELLHSQSPLWRAVAAPIPWHGAGSATFIYIPNRNGPGIDGFVQAVKRMGRPEADVVRIAPRHDAHEAASTIWDELLTHLVSSAGAHGIQRVYACLRNDNPSLAIVMKSGFAPYIEETLYHLPEIPLTTARTEVDCPNVRPQLEQDSFALQRLHRCFTPPLVQRAEGVLVSNGEAPSPLDLRAWWQPEQFEGFVYERAQEIVAAVQIQRGRQAHWLRVLADSNAADVMGELLDCALHAAAHYRKRTIYCSLRPYQEGLAPLLHERGFKAIASLTRLVKHTTREIRQEVAAPAKELFEVTLTGILTSNHPHDAHGVNTEVSVIHFNGKTS
ncbi:MAG: hypothetical protein GXP42_02405 [Chloroflexi bacterium]|nr:hypothetical protein [Chloroflexota bacterium]